MTATVLAALIPAIAGEQQQQGEADRVSQYKADSIPETADLSKWTYFGAIDSLSTRLH